MALAKKAGKVAKGGARAASMNVDDMFAGGGGLPDLFRGTIASARLAKWESKEGSGFGPRLAAVLMIEPADADDQPDDAVLPAKHLEENDGMVKALYGVGKLAEWLPSMDGEEPVDVDADEEGIYAVPTAALIEKFERTGNEGTPQLNRGTNWAFFLQKLIDIGYDKKHLLPNIDSLEGTEAVFCRVPPPERGGMQASATGDDGQRKDNKILVVTELISVPYKGTAKAKSAGASASKPAAKPAAKAASKRAAAKAEENGAGELDELLTAAIVEALSEADVVEDDEGNEVQRLSKNKVSKVAVSSLDMSQKKDGLARLKEEEFWEAAAQFSLDAETDEVTLLEA